MKIPRANLLFALAVLLAVLSCRQAALQMGVSPSPTASHPPTPSPSPTLDVSSLWYLTRGGAKLDQGWGVDVDGDGNIYFATYQQAQGELFTDMVIYKFDSAGEERWQARWGGKFMEKVFMAAAAGPVVYIGGLTYTAANLTEADMAVLALNSADGSLLWAFTWGQGYGYEEVDGLVVDGDFIYISGWTTGETTGNDVAILKLDRDGKLVWTQTWGSSGWDQGDGQIVVDEDAIYVAGRYNGKSILLGGQGYVARFSKENGQYLSHQAWGGPVFTDALGMTGDGTFLYVVGLTLDKGNGGQIFLRKLDKTLNLIWEQAWGGPKSESARAVAIDQLGNILVAGETGSSSSGGLDIVLLRYDPDGNLLWSQTWGGPQNEGALGIALVDGFACIAANTHSFGSGQDDALLLKVSGETGQFPAILPASRTPAP